MKNKGFTLVELIAVLAILAIIIGLGTSVYINVQRNILEQDYENVVTKLENAALSYARDLKTTEILNLSVQYLIDEGYLIPDDNKIIYDPRDNTSMNCFMIHVVFDNGDYKATLGREYNDESGKCDESYIETGKVEIYCNGEKCKDDWYNHEVTLSIYGLSLEEINNSKIEWSSLQGDFYTTKTIEVKPSNVLNTTFNVNVTTNDKVYDVKKNIKIDMEKPSIYNVGLDNTKGWNKNNSIVFEVSDKNGSGIYGYSITESNDCENASFIKKVDSRYKIEVPNGNYYICVKDNAGNINGTTEAIEVKNVDSNPPRITIVTSKEWGLTNSATITFEDLESGITSYGVEENGKITWTNVEATTTPITITQNHNENKTYKVYAKDAASNETEKEVVIDHIDKEGPTIEVINNYNSSLWFRNYYVNLKFTDNEIGLSSYQVTIEDQEPASWGSISGNTITKSYYVNKNGTYYVWSKDKLGNISKTTFIIANIDSFGPTINVNDFDSTWSNIAKDITINIDDSESGFKYFTASYYDEFGKWQSGKSFYNATETLKIGGEMLYINAYDNVNNYSYKNINVNADVIKPYTPYLPGIGESYSFTSDGYTFTFTCTNNVSGTYDPVNCTIDMSAGSWVSFGIGSSDIGSGIASYYCEIWMSGSLVTSGDENSSCWNYRSSNSRKFTQKTYSIDKAGNKSNALEVYYNFH